MVSGRLSCSFRLQDLAGGEDRPGTDSGTALEVELRPRGSGLLPGVLQHVESLQRGLVVFLGDREAGLRVPQLSFSWVLLILRLECPLESPRV